MSTAFMVDNILNEVEHISSVMSSDNEESEDSASDLKDSLCGSPLANYQNNNNVHLENQNHIATVERDHVSEDLIRTYNMIRDSRRLVVELCCIKCGHFQLKGGPQDDSSGNSKPPFKCEKCGGNEFIANNSNCDDEKEETIIKEAKPVLKFSVSAILSDNKSNKECVKVRNGEPKVFYYVQTIKWGPIVDFRVKLDASNLGGGEHHLVRLLVPLWKMIKWSFSLQGRVRFHLKYVLIRCYSISCAARKFKLFSRNKNENLSLR